MQPHRAGFQLDGPLLGNPSKRREAPSNYGSRQHCGLFDVASALKVGVAARRLLVARGGNSVGRQSMWQHYQHH
jgi:hypothetical protein